jgi:hypothetical protein
VAHHRARPVPTAVSAYAASVPAATSVPLVVRSTPQPSTAGVRIGRAAAGAARGTRRHLAHKAPAAGVTADASPDVSKAPATTLPVKPVVVAKPPVAQPVTQVTTETTQLPPAPEAAPQPPAPAAEPPSTTTPTDTAPLPATPSSPSVGEGPESGAGVGESPTRPEAAPEEDPAATGGTPAGEATQP